MKVGVLVSSMDGSYYDLKNGVIHENHLIGVSNENGEW